MHRDLQKHIKISPVFEEDIFDAIHEKLVPLPGHVAENGCTEAEAIRRGKLGV